MEEKIIIKNIHYNKERYIKYAKIISFILLAVLIIIELIGGMFFAPFENLFDLDILDFIVDAWYVYILWLFLPTVGVYFLLKFTYVMYSKEELVLTNKRVYGKTIFGVHVDLPIQSISGVSELGIFRGVSVSTSSKSIYFVFVKNASEIRQEISSLLMSRVEENKKDNTSKDDKETVSGIDELKKLKDLLDNDIITQEEFDAKKKQLLGL